MIREEKAKNNWAASRRTLGITSVEGDGFRQTGERRKFTVERRGRARWLPGGAAARRVFRRLVFFQPAGLLGGAPQDELDLRVEAAQIIVRPALHGVEHGRIDTKQERLAIGHDGY